MVVLTEREVRAVVGKRADYYLAKWGPHLAGGEGRPAAAGFNWAAFLLTGLWLPYRKMRRTAAIFFGVLLLESLVETGILGGLSAAELPDGLGFAITVAIAFVCGMLGNRWYLEHVRGIVAEVRSLSLPEEEHLWALERRGGTSVAMAIVFTATAVFVTGVALFFFELAVIGLTGEP